MASRGADATGMGQVDSERGGKGEGGVAPANYQVLNILTRIARLHGQRLY